MIDTGSTRSFISPEIADRYFENFKRRERFEVISTHAASRHSEVVDITLPTIFKTHDKHKFYVYSVDNRYDGLIGSDLLQQLQANIDMKTQTLFTKDTQIPIIYTPPVRETYILPPRCELRVRIPVNLLNGEAILDYKQFADGIRMPCALVSCVNGFAYTIIQNTTDTELDMVVTAPFKVESWEKEYVETNINFNESSSDNLDSILTNNLKKLRFEHMNEEEKEVMEKICEEYKDIFYCEDIPLSFTNQVKHKIRTKNEDPIHIRAYRLPPCQTAEIKKQVDKMLKDNVVRESYSPWSAPVHLVPKKMDASGTKKWRMVVDYRRLNDITIDDKYPLPNINDLFDMLGKSMYFTTLDLASGYHQIEVQEEDREKTGFSTPFGHFEFNRMPFGLKTAPATFQRAMNNVLKGLQGLHCLVYLDDVIIFSKSLQEHSQKLKAVFDRFRETNLKVQLDKSHFLRKEVLYLGHTITRDGLKPNTDKIDAILNYPLPKTTTEIKSFLGLLGYYRKFIRDFARITKPMTLCLKKKSKIIITEEYKECFETCKKLLTNAPLLQYPDFSKEFLLTTDASGCAIGAVLSQGPVGSDRPVAYASRTLSDTECRYSTIERELLAVVWATKHFRPYLYGKKFTIYTDHRPLAWLDSIKEPNSKLTNWRLSLGQYTYSVKYKKGPQNTNADALSRIKLSQESKEIDLNMLEADDISMKVNTDRDAEEEFDLEQFLNDAATKVLSPSKDKDNLNEETEDTKSESGLSLSSNEDAQEEIIEISDSEDGATAHSISNREHEGIPILKEAIDTKPRQILVFSWLKDEVSVLDIGSKKQNITQVHMPTGNEKLVKKFLKEYINPKNKYFIYFEDQIFRKTFAKVVTSLFKKNTLNMVECTERVVNLSEDESDQRRVIAQYHEGKTCHRGIKETLAKIKRNYFWTNMKETISAYINSCEQCRKMKYERKPIKPPIQLTQTQHAPFQEAFMDLLFIEGHYYLTIVDAFSKLGQAIGIPNRSTPEVVRALIKYFSMYGIPSKINSDSGTEFNNELIKEFMLLYKIEMHIGTPNNPNSMGIVERFHSTIIEIYRLAKYDKSDLDAASVMTYAIMAYNNTIHSATNCTPFEVVFGQTDVGNTFDINKEHHILQKLLQDHRKRLTVLYEYIADRLIENKVKVRNKKGGQEPPVIKQGDEIFMKNTRTRKAKELPRFEKAQVIGEPERNIVPVLLKKRKTRVALKNVKRPPQVVPNDAAGPSRPRIQPKAPESRAESGDNSDEDRSSSGED